MSYFSPEGKEIHALISSFSKTPQSMGEMLNSSIYYYTAYQAYGRSIDIYQSLKSFRAIVDEIQVGQYGGLSQLALEQLYALVWMNKQLIELRFADIRSEQLLFEVDNHFLTHAEALSTSETYHSGKVAILLRYCRLRMQVFRIEEWLTSLSVLIDAKPTHSLSGAESDAALFLGHPHYSTDLVSERAGLARQCLKLFEAKHHWEGLVAFAKRNIVDILGTLRPVNFSENRFSGLAYLINREKGHTYNNELTWQTGDAGIALLLYEASAVLRDQELLDLADLIGLNTLLRKDSSATGVSTAAFLSGSAGIALLYQKLHQVSGHPSYQTGYEYWLSKTRAWVARDLANGNLRQAPGLLEGVVGTGLFLLSAVTTKNLKWEQVLLGA